MNVNPEFTPFELVIKNLHDQYDQWEIEHDTIFNKKMNVRLEFNGKFDRPKINTNFLQKRRLRKAIEYCMYKIMNDRSLI